MRKGCLIALVLGVLFLLFMAVGAISLLRSLLYVDEYISDRTVLVLDLSGDIPDTAPADLVGRLFQSPQLTFFDVLELIEHASHDRRICGIWLKMKHPDIGWAKAQELASKIQRFRLSGKPVFASMDVADEKDYMVAAAADKIFLSPEAAFEFNGFAMSALSLRDMFDKLGVQPEVVNIGKYKSSGEMLKNYKMSDARREEMESLLRQTHDQFIDTVVKSRKGTTSGTIRECLEKGLFTSQGAMEMGLIDGIKYEDEVEGMFASIAGSKQPRLKTVQAGKYRRIVSMSHEEGFAPKIVIINASGLIVFGDDSYSPMFGKALGSESVISSIRKARDNKQVKGIIVRIDSPGGDALASDLIWREVRNADTVKPVVASMSDVAASGGYYIAMGCRKIVAQPGSITGSIGVVSAKFNLEKLYLDRLGLRFETMKIGRWADMMDSTRAMTPDEWQRFQDQTRRVYDRFLAKVAESRKADANKIEAFAQGRVWTGSQAKERGLVDEMGGLDEAVNLVKKFAGYHEGQPVQLVTYPELPSLWDQVWSSIPDGARTFANPDIIAGIQYLGRFLHPAGGVFLAVMPYQIDIH